MDSLTLQVRIIKKVFDLYLGRWKKESEALREGRRTKISCFWALSLSHMQISRVYGVVEGGQNCRSELQLDEVQNIIDEMNKTLY